MTAQIFSGGRNGTIHGRGQAVRTVSRFGFRLMVSIAVLAGCLMLPAGSSAAESVASPHPNWQNVARGKPVQIKTAPSYAEVSDPDDARQLVDGQFASKQPIWYDKAAVGWMRPEPIEFTIDLGEVMPIRGVALRSGAGQAGVGWPKQIRIYVSDTGKTFSPAGEIMKVTPNRPAASSYHEAWLRADQLKAHGRFVRFVVTPMDTGNGVYFFTDEVEVYKGDNALLKQALAEPEGEGSADSPRPQLQNLALEKPVQFNTPPNYAETKDGDDVKQMVDGRLSPATPMWNDKSCVGWVMVDPTVFTVDLGQVQPIRGAALHLGAGQAGAEWPASIQVYVSESGDKFSPVGDLMQLAAQRPPAQGYASLWIATDKLQTHGRYVKFVCLPRNLGNGAYIFADELEIYRGEDEWLNRPLLAANAPEQWRADWSQIEWRDNADTTPESERPRPVVLVDGKTETGKDALLQQSLVGKDGVTFTLKGQAGKPRSMSWTGKLPNFISTEKCRYALLSFRAEGIRRTYEPAPLVMLQGFNDKSSDNSVILLEANLAPNDGRSHTLLTQLPEGFTINQIRVALVTESDAPRLVLERIELLRDAPEVFGAEVVRGAAASKPGFIPVKLGAALNGTLAQWYESALAKHKTLMDGARLLWAGPVAVSGVPFEISSGEKYLAVMPESKESDERVKFLGEMVDRRFLEPESRHDTLSVDVDAQAREVFLLLALSARPIQVLGGQPHTALHLDDIESLSIELTYDRGEPETSFPYSLADKACYIPARELGAYAVAADPTRRLKRITLHNRHFGPNFALAAVTLNTSDRPLVPELAAAAAPQATRHNPEPAARPLSIRVEGNRLMIGNRWYECGFNLGQGFVLDRFVNRWNESAPVRLDPSSGLRLRIGETVYTGRCFNAKVLRTMKTEAQLLLTSTRADLPLELMVTISASEQSPQLSFTVKTTNRGAKPLAAELCLPALSGLSLGDLEQTRLFFPQYRAVDTAEPVALRAPYGPEYTSQFMDLYNRAAGAGLMVCTDNAAQEMADFALRKDDSGLAGGVCFPADYNELAPGASREHVPVSLVAHDGDWRTAFAMHRDWVRTWYKPHKSQDKDYLLNAWEIACYRTSDVISWMDTKVPPFITADRTKFLSDEVFAFEKEHHGHKPDLVHFFNWTYNDKKKRNEYGVFGTPLAYEQVGGIEFFRKGIADLQERLQTPVSLYTLIDRFRASALPDQELARDLVARAWHQEPDKDSDASSALRASGQPDGIYFLRCGDQRWYDFELDDIVRMQRDTGCKMVYIDVFSYWSHLKGYDGVSPRQADRTVLKYLKDKLPADVAIWSEYPPTDVASQWEDGSLQYYFLHLNEVFARRYNYADRSHDLFKEMPISIGRFLLPHYKSIGLPGYIEASNSPSQVDAIFVNGEAIQEDTWRLHHSRIRQKLNRAYVIKHAYNDCFNSDNPSPQVDTAAEGLVANLFPGTNRNLWTLYNARPRTYGGVVLVVPHHPGAKYRDAWNDRELSPSVENGMARLTLTLDPQQPGCIVQDWNGSDH